MTHSSDTSAEDELRRQLALGDVVLETIGPVLGHLLANQDQTLFSDEIVSRVRGMLEDLARQVCTADEETGEDGDETSDGVYRLAERLAGEAELLRHCHALALEWQLTARLETRNAIDPVLSPLVQALIASDEAATAGTAMAFLAAQARFVQQQRRMELPLGELPADLLHAVLACWREHQTGGAEEAAETTQARIRDGYDEGASRIGLLSRLVSGMGGGVGAALSVSHAGVAMFVSALAAATHQPRDLVIISTNDRQVARLALALRAAGLKPAAVEEQFLYLHPEVAPPDGFDAVSADRAAAMLAAAGHWTAD